MRRLIASAIWLVTILGFTLGVTACKGTANQAAPTPDMTAQAAKSQLVAEGEVVPLRFASLSFNAGGMVEEVTAEENSKVAAGEVIARLEGKERLGAEITQAELELESARQALQELYDNTEQTRADAQLALAQADKAYDDAKDRREKLDLSYRDRDQIDRAYANFILAEQAVKDAEKAYDDFASWRDEEDPIRANFLSSLAAARINRDRALAQLDYLRTGPSQYVIAEADSQIVVAEAALEKAKADWEDLEDGLDDDAVSLAQTRLANAEAQILAAQKALSDLELKAPFDATVITCNLKVGEVVSAYTTVVTVADITYWKVETTDLTELDVPDVAPGMPVTVRFDALPDVELSGVVEKINDLGVNKQGDITYTTTISLDDIDERLRWKMTAYVTFPEH